jgi:phosphonate transport system permease protein
MSTPLSTQMDRASYHDYVWTGARPLTLRSWLLSIAAVAAVAFILAWSAQGTQLSWGELADGLPQIGDFLSRSFPPNWKILGNLVGPAVETVQIAVWGTLLGVMRRHSAVVPGRAQPQSNRWVYQARARR